MINNYDRMFDIIVKHIKSIDGYSRYYYLHNDILTLENALSWLSNDVIIVNDISIDYDVDEEAIEKIGRGFSQSCLN